MKRKILFICLLIIVSICTLQIQVKAEVDYEAMVSGAVAIMRSKADEEDKDLIVDDTKTEEGEVIDGVLTYDVQLWLPAQSPITFEVAIGVDEKGFGDFYFNKVDNYVWEIRNAVSYGKGSNTMYSRWVFDLDITPPDHNCNLKIEMRATETKELLTRLNINILVIPNSNISNLEDNKDNNEYNHIMKSEEITRKLESACLTDIKSEALYPISEKTNETAVTYFLSCAVSDKIYDNFINLSKEEIADWIYKLTYSDPSEFFGEYDEFELANKEEWLELVNSTLGTIHNYWNAPGRTESGLTDGDKEQIKQALDGTKESAEYFVENAQSQRIDDYTQRQNEINSEIDKLISILEAKYADEEDRITYNNFYDIFENVSDYEITDNTSDEDVTKLQNKVNIILTVITNIGMILAVLMSAILGVKYMLGSVEEKAEYKKDLVPYFIGAGLLFGICAIVKVLQQLGQTINNI